MIDKSAFDVAHQNSKIDSKIIAALERVSQAFRVLLWNESKTYALSPIQVQVLVFLLHHEVDKRKVSYLAEEFNMTKATISETIKTLTQKSLITKVFDPLDTRSYYIHLTTQGKIIAEKSSLFSHHLETPIHAMETAEKEQLLGSLLHIIQHLQKSGVITIQRMCLSCHYYEHQQPNQHYCKLLQSTLEVKDLRIDCPEHSPMSA